MSCSSILCCALLPATAQPRCGRSERTLTERKKKTLHTSGRPPPHSTPCCSHSGVGYKHRHARFSDPSRSFLHLKALLKDSPRNGDSCGVCPNWQRPQPRAGNGAGPRAGLRRRASVQQPLLHRRRRLRDGVVSCSRSVSGWHFLILARRKRRLTRIFSVSNCHVSSG